MRKYMTEQRDLLLTFLREHLHEQLSIEEIASHISVENGISRSAIYRNIERLVEEGAVRRLATGKGRSFLYQYTGNEECSRHLHLQCVECGQVLHMKNEATRFVLDMVQKDSGFRINEKNSTLVGLCHACAEKRKKVPLATQRTRH